MFGSRLPIELMFPMPQDVALELADASFDNSIYDGSDEPAAYAHLAESTIMSKKKDAKSTKKEG